MYLYFACKHVTTYISIITLFKYWLTWHHLFTAHPWWNCNEGTQQRLHFDSDLLIWFNGFQSVSWICVHHVTMTSSSVNTLTLIHSYFYINWYSWIQFNWKKGNRSAVLSKTDQIYGCEITASLWINNNVLLHENVMVTWSFTE